MVDCSQLSRSCSGLQFFPETGHGDHRGVFQHRAGAQPRSGLWVWQRDVLGSLRFSRGAHHREDFPDSGTMESSYFTVAKQTGETLHVTREDVQFTIVRPGETILPDHEPETLVANP